MRRIGKHAVVIGASMGGLLAARAASDFFENVTVLERDVFPEQDVPRKGVPQGHHAHGLLARGCQVIEDFFPGWTDEVVASGGSRSDIADDAIWIVHGLTLKTGPSDMAGLLASRPVLEGHVRRRLLSLPNVKAIENCSVQAINGVRVKIGGSAEQAVMADLVIDASGRGSSSPALK
jgi:2-polyprenyl-6-methoxyphenol hydroxylase-like FAD-dependent oxidoreductase